MVATIIVLVIVIAGTAYFYLKLNFMTALTTLLASILSSVLAFSYYEQLAGLLATQKWAISWIQSAAFLLIFLLGFLLIRTLSDFLVKSNITVGRMPKLVATLLGGVMTGVIISGVLLVSLALSPLSPKLYSRYPLSKPIQADFSSPPIINADGFVASLYSWISRSSLSSSKSFSVFHADYLDRLHLDRYAVDMKFPAVCSSQALKMPGRNTKPIRLWALPDHPRLVVIRVGIVGAPVVKGGAGRDGKVDFIPAQFRLITKPKEQTGTYTGKGKVLYPLGQISNGQLELLALNQEMSREYGSLGSDRTWWLDLAFRIPPEQRGVLLSFKQNAIIELPKAVPTNEEIEKALDGE